MARVDFVISNHRHHLAAARPVAAALAAAGGCRCRLLSMCELRGLPTPAAEPELWRVRRLVPPGLRRSPAAGAGPGSAGRGRRLLRAASWRLLVGPRLAALLRRRPDLMVLPNDAAFPYDRIARLLDRRRVPWLLLQEGIRFPLPGGAGEPVYGAGGAAAIAAWGESSGEYFRAAGAPPERVHLTGSPRFDGLAALAGRPEEARRRWGLTRRTLLLASNPIDDQGFCSRHEKMALLGRFLEQLEPLFSDPELQVAIKLHGRESREEFRALAARATGRPVRVFADEPLWPLLAGAGAVVVLASTVGLEALLCGRPLGVLEIPGHGFQYDYVDSGAATGLAWNAPMAPQVSSLFEPSAQRQARVQAYMRRQLETQHQAGERVAALVRRLLADGR